MPEICQAVLEIEEQAEVISDAQPPYLGEGQQKPKLKLFIATTPYSLDRV